MDVETFIFGSHGVTLESMKSTMRNNVIPTIFRLLDHLGDEGGKVNSDVKCAVELLLKKQYVYRFSVKNKKGKAIRFPWTVLR